MTRVLGRKMTRTRSVIATIALMIGGNVVAQSDPCMVTTTHGDVVGVRRGGVCTYLGIPYAAPPLGSLRWKSPQARAPWAPTPLNATSAGAVCAQLSLAGTPTGSEDCLTLNVWTPTIASSRRGVPVLVWLHTGGFQATSSNFPASDGRRFADERGAIVVAPNYRLGPFGFLAHNALSHETPGYESSGNYGLADQRAALAWVKDNIAAFGGDPDNVTLAGTSAGAVSVSLHLVSPASRGPGRGFFHRAIMQSGVAASHWPTASEAEAQGDRFAAALGCNDRANVLTCMRAASRDQVLLALPVGLNQILEQQGRVFWGPTVDDLEIPDQPRELYRRGQFIRMPVIIGTTGDEGWTFVDRSFPAGLDVLQYEMVVRAEFGMDASSVLRTYPVGAFPTPKDALARLTGDVEFVCEARRVARAMYHDGAPVYLYSFEQTVDDVTPGRAFHGLESNFLFGNNFGPPSNHVLTHGELSLFGSMSTLLAGLCRNRLPQPPRQSASVAALSPCGAQHCGSAHLGSVPDTGPQHQRSELSKGLAVQLLGIV